MVQTEIRFVTPLASDPPLVSADAAPPLRVLVVDDEDIVRHVIATSLRRAGFNVDEARDGLEALERLRTAAPDIVLTDLDMPRCNGARLCAAIKGNRATADIPVLLMTGGAPDEARMRELGCHAVLYKPLPPSLATWIARSVEDAQSDARENTRLGPGR